MASHLLGLILIHSIVNQSEGAMAYLDQPEKPEFDFARERWNEFMFQPTMRLEIKMRAENLAWAYERLLSMPVQELEQLADREANAPALLWVTSNAILRAGKTGKYSEIDKMLDRIIGKAPPTFHLTEEGRNARAVTFSEFCVRAGYPAPFPKQIEMMEFGMREPNAKLLLGSRGYGKTEYVVIMGIAWSLFNDPLKSFLVVTKSESRNKGIVREIENALIANGVEFETSTALSLRVAGSKGKEPSCEAITIGSRSVRGRHPDKVIMDDPVTPEDGASLAARNAAQTLYFELCKITNDILIIGQPVHKADLYADLRPRLKGLEVPHGTIPELDHDLVAMKAAGVSLASIESSYHLRVPVDGSNPLHGIQSMPEFTHGSCVAFIDPSFEGGDYTAMTVVRQYFDGVAVYGKLWKKAWYDCMDDFKQVVDEKGVEILAFEINSLGQQPIRMLKDKLKIKIQPWRTLTEKHARIMLLGPFAKSIYVSNDSDVDYVKQVRDYEYKVKNDDAPDSLASALEWIGLVKGPKR